MSDATTRLEVRLERRPGVDRPVGALALHQRQIYFEYATAFLAEARALSPFKLPLRPGLHPAPGSGLHGLFADALPDSWGQLLMDRHLRRLGRVPERLSPLDRLAYLGSRTMGALTFHPCTDDAPAQRESIPLEVLASAARDVLAGTSAEILPLLRRVGGSPGGARPKVLVSVRGDDLVYGLDPAPLGFQAWMIKFTAESEPRDAGATEYVYSRLARRAGLEVPETRLFAAADGRRYFGVRRFDRADDERVHVHTLAGLLDVDFRVPSLDYEHLLRVAMRLTRSQVEVRRAFRQLIFNVLAHNRDDHGKNFSFVQDLAGEWRLSPAYDLTFAEGPGGEHTLSIAGEGLRPTWQHLMRLAKLASIDERRAHTIADEVRGALRCWPEEARAEGLADATIDRIAARLAAVDAALELPPRVTPAARRPAAPRAPGT